MEADRIKNFFAQDLVKALWDANWAEPEDEALDALEVERTDAPVLVGTNGGRR
jgi:hypothetical protein